jgi:lactoylglutathione lyase
MPSTTITDVHTVGVHVSDQDRAVEFYLDRLGFEKRLDAPISSTLRWIEVAPPGGATSIALIGGDTTPATNGETGVRFTVPDAQVEHDTMRDRGVNVGDLLRWDGVPPMYTFKDPDGNGFEVIEEPLRGD